MLRCPNCGSRSVYQIAGGYLGQIYRCKSCGYRGSLIMECEKPENSEDEREDPRD